MNRWTALGATKPRTIVRFSNGERGVVVRQDDDDFDEMTLVFCNERRRRSPDDSRMYRFAADTAVEVMGTVPS